MHLLGRAGVEVAAPGDEQRVAREHAAWTLRAAVDDVAHVARRVAGGKEHTHLHVAATAGDAERVAMAQITSSVLEGSMSSSTTMT